MRVLEFVKWWWNSNDGFNRSIVLFFVWMIVSSPFAFALGGAHAIALSAVAYIVGVVIFWILHFVFLFIRESWNQFNMENPTEEQKIISRLRGDDLT